MTLDPTNLDDYIATLRLKEVKREVQSREESVMLNIRASLVLVVSVMVLGGSPHLLSAQQVTPVDRSATISFYPISELTRPAGAQPTLRGARLANPKDWPASFYSVHPGGSCTSTLVGPRALLTAAHCAPNKAAVAIQLAGNVYKGTCTQSDLYSPSSADGRSADWAICLMDSDVPVSKYETLNVDSLRVRVGGQLLLTGFGCTQATGIGGNDGNYRIGEAKVTALPSGSNNDITTSGDVALCYGDSGGGAFIFLDPGKKRRIQVSVNSRIGVMENGKLGNDSYLSSVSTSAAQSFLKIWASANSADICGLTQGAKRCRE